MMCNPTGISRMSATIAVPRRPQSAAIGAGWSALLVQIGVALPPQLLWATGERIAGADGSPGVAIAHLPAAVIVMIITGLLIAGTLESRPGCRGCRCWAFCRALACWQASASIPGYGSASGSPSDS
jgi:hypothetical protein